MVGQTLGPYRVLSKLGEGGMGEVYKANDTRLDRVVALKILPGNLAGDPSARARFEREAKAIAALNHPGICALFDVGQDRGADFLVMELLEGSTLHDRLQRGPVDLASLLDWAIALADALEAAHERGLIHRDLKPANIFITSRNVPKILDFGLAKPMDQDDEATRQADGIVTTLGTTVGTLSYMSPEQLRGDPLDARTDLFSLGLVFYEMATGHRAFAGPTTAVITAGILSQDVRPPRELRPELPQKLEETILKALEKDRELRCQSAAELRADLMRVRREISNRSRASAAATVVAAAASAVSSSAPSTPPAAVPVAPTPASDRPAPVTPPIVAAAPEMSTSVAGSGGHVGPWIVSAALILVIGGGAAAYFVTHKSPAASNRETTPATPPATPPPSAAPAPAPIAPAPLPTTRSASAAEGTSAPPSTSNRGPASSSPVGTVAAAPAPAKEAPASSEPKASAPPTTAAPTRTRSVAPLEARANPMPAGRAALPGRGRGRGFGQPALAFANQLKKLPAQTYRIMFSTGHPESQRLAMQLRGLLDSGGWSCSGVAPAPQPPAEGVFQVGVPHQSAAATTFVNWATRAGYNPEYRIMPALKEIHIVIGPPKAD